MGHTNSTTYYNLPQFLTSDKPAWLTDINNAFSDIDTAVHSAQSDANTAGSNATQALLDASAASSAAATADAKGAGAVASIEAAFDATAVYAIGTKVMYNSLLYRCTVAVTTPGPWTGSANWERITVDSIIPGNAGDLPLGSLTPAPAGSTAEAIASHSTDISAYFVPASLTGLETFERVFFDSVKNRVYGYLACRTSDVISTGTAIWTINSAYRPLENYGFPCTISVNNTLSFYYSTIGSNGLISQTLTGSCKGFYMAFEYYI